MLMINRTHRLLICVLVVGTILGACRPAPVPVIEGGQILVNPDTDIRINEQATLRIDVVVQGATPKFSWSAERGTISSANAPSVIYTAPSTPGPDLVNVVVTAGETTFTQAISFNVVEPLPSPTPTPTEDLSTPTAAPEPIACELRPTTQNLFPQLANEVGQFPIHGPVDGAGAEDFHCEVVSDLVHDLPMAVHIKYAKVTDNNGWWGVATPNGYNASKYSQLCFWAYTNQPFQSFRVKMKDTSGMENGVPVTIKTANKWEPICTDVSKFKELGINTEKMDNINLGFEAPLGSAEIWVADFEFK
jgi:hypothetical protein